MAAHFASRQRRCGNLTVAYRREVDHIQLAIGIVAALLAGWFFGCIITYKAGNRILVKWEIASLLRAWGLRALNL